MSDPIKSLHVKIRELSATKYRGAKWHRECGASLSEIVDAVEVQSGERVAELLAALQLCYDHCRVYHREVESNNVGEAVRAALAKAGAAP